MHQWGDPYADRVDDIKPDDRVRVKPGAFPYPGRPGDAVSIEVDGGITVEFTSLERVTYDQDMLIKVGDPAKVKLAFIDIDGVLADNSKRLQDCTTGFKNDKPVIEWSKFFEPARVSADTLIAGTPERLHALANNGYELIFLTGRPHYLEDVTLFWLARHIVTPYTLLCKPEEATYSKTAVWKASIIYALARFMKATDILIVDDDPRNAAAHIQNEHYKIQHFDNLADTTAIGEV